MNFLLSKEVNMKESINNKIRNFERKHPNLPLILAVIAFIVSFFKP